MAKKEAKVQVDEKDVLEYARNTELAELEKTNKDQFDAVIAVAIGVNDWKESIDEASDAYVQSVVEPEPPARETPPEIKPPPEQHHPAPKEVYTHEVKTITLEIPIADLPSGNLPVHCNCRLGRGTEAQRKAWKRVWQALRLREAPVSSHRPIAGFNEVFRWFLNELAEAIDDK